MRIQKFRRSFNQKIYNPKIVFTFLILLVSSYFLFWWLYKLDTLPGLHGDEAWSGLQADRLLKNEIENLKGMNTYTGIFQQLLAAISFKLSKVGVFQLRIFSVLFNIIGLVIFYFSLIKDGKRVVISFLLIISISSLYMTSPRIAWEVNTFTLFFLGILFRIIKKIFNGPSPAKKVDYMTFFALNLIASYNHIIFSSISLAALIGLVLWSLYFEDWRYKRIIIMLCLNLFNILVLFLLMRFNTNTLIGPKIVYLSLAFSLCFLLEVVIIEKICKLRFCIVISIPKQLTLAVLFLGIVIFMRFHALGLFDTFCSYKILTNVYSFSPSLIVKILLSSIAFFLLVFIIKCFSVDLRSGNLALVPFFMISYLSVLPLYTTGNSLRYYLIAYVILAVYLAYKLKGRTFYRKFILYILLIGFILSNFMLSSFFFGEQTIVVQNLIVGNNTIESSGHFLPKEPLIKFLQQRRIGNIAFTGDEYFFYTPICFYKLITPWRQDNNDKIVVGYDYKEQGTGYIISVITSP